MGENHNCRTAQPMAVTKGTSSPRASEKPSEVGAALPPGAAWPPGPTRPPSLGATFPAPAHATGVDPRCLFGIAAADGKACCAIECGTCQEDGCRYLPSEPEDCCPSLINRSLRKCSETIAPCTLEKLVNVPNALCEDDLRHCNLDVLRFAT